MLRTIWSTFGLGAPRVIEPTKIDSADGATPHFRDRSAILVYNHGFEEPPR